MISHKMFMPVLTPPGTIVTDAKEGGYRSCRQWGITFNFIG